MMLTDLAYPLTGAFTQNTKDLAPDALTKLLEDMNLQKNIRMTRGQQRLW